MLTCKECDDQMSLKEEWETIVGFEKIPGHDHNDNCTIRIYTCKNGHEIKLSIRKRCPNPDCDWIGKDSCFCHSGKKVDGWPD